MQIKQSYEISQWLQMLEEPWKSRAIEAAIKSPKTILLTGIKGQAKSFKDALMKAFWWPHEGDVPHPDEWIRIYEKPKKYVQPKYHHFL